MDWGELLTVLRLQLPGLQACYLVACDQPCLQSREGDNYQKLLRIFVIRKTRIDNAPKGENLK